MPAVNDFVATSARGHGADGFDCLIAEIRQLFHVLLQGMAGNKKAEYFLLIGKALMFFPLWNVRQLLSCAIGLLFIEYAKQSMLARSPCRAASSAPAL